MVGASPARDGLLKAVARWVLERISMECFTSYYTHF